MLTPRSPSIGHCPPPEHPEKRQVGVRPCVHVHGLDQQWLWSSTAWQEQRGRASAPVQLPGGSREPLLRLLPASAPSELRSQQPKVRQLLISPGPQPRQPGPLPERGDALCPPLLSALFHAWEQGLVTKCQLSLTGTA